MLILFYTFFIIGLFGFGGGYGMLSLIQHEVVKSHHWLSSAEFTNIVAISQMTPGPIGINSATYCGYTAMYNSTGNHWIGIAGSIIATSALVLPSFVLMILISRLFLKHMRSPLVQDVFKMLRPAVVGLLAAATLLLCNEENFSSPTADLYHFIVSLAIFLVTFVSIKFFRINPIKMIGVAALAGLVFFLLVPMA